MILRRAKVGQDGRTPFETIHGQRWRGKMVEFGEQVFYFVPKRLRAKLNLRWRLGVFLGNAQSTNECYVGAANGDVIKTRAVTRVVEASRWSAQAIQQIKGTPNCFRPASQTESDVAIEEFFDPHVNADGEKEVQIDAPEMAKLDKQIRITRKDLDNLGYTEGCQRCTDMRAGIDRTMDPPQ